MLRIPSNLFQHVYSFTSPKDIFTSKSVSRGFLEECSQYALWNNVIKLHHPGLPHVANPEAAIHDMMRPRSLPRLEDFEFILTLYRGESKIGTTMTWKSREVPTPKDIPSQWKPEFDQARYVFLPISGDQSPKLECRLYIIFKEQYRCIKLEFVQSYPTLQFSDAEFTDCNCDVTALDIDFKENEDGEWKILLSFVQWEGDGYQDSWTSAGRSHYGA